MGEHEAQGRSGVTGGRWGKRLGAAAFVFFLVKGLAWLVVPLAAAAIATR